MIKKLIVNTLLKRGASKVEEAAGKAIRHLVLSSGGAMLLSKGLADGNEIEQLAGAAAVLAGIVISLVRSYIQDKL